MNDGRSVDSKRRLVIAMLAMAPGFADVRTRIPLATFAGLPDVNVHYIERSAALPELPINQPKVLIVLRQLPQSLEYLRRFGVTVKSYALTTGCLKCPNRPNAS